MGKHRKALLGGKGLKTVSLKILSEAEPRQQGLIRTPELGFNESRKFFNEYGAYDEILQRRRRVTPPGMSELFPLHIGQDMKRCVPPVLGTVELNVAKAKRKSNNYGCEDEERGVFQKSQS